MRFLLLAIIGGVFVLPARAEDTFFRILAPSRESRKLLVIHAKSTDAGLQLRTVHKVNITFGGRSIARNRAGTRFFISGKANSIGENWAIVDFDEAKRTWKRPRTFTMPRDYSYLSLDREERFLLACNYGEGVVDVFRLREDGTREELAASLQEGRKTAHCVLVSPDNRFLYIPYVKENNALYQYSFDAASGEVKPLDPLNVNPPEGTGPRHLAYHPKLPLLYFSEEQGLGVSIYRQGEDGKLAFWKSASAVGDEAPAEGVSSSDILLTPDGRFAYAGIRGHKHDFDFIAGYAVQPDGDLKPLGLTKTGKIPWGLATSPDGRYLVVTEFGEGALSVYQIGADGKLTRAATLEVDKQISDVETR